MAVDTAGKMPGVLVPLEKGQKLFQCGLCSTAFDFSILLNQHIEQHAFTKPYQCGYCKVSYDSHRELDSHVKTHSLLFCIPSRPSTSSGLPDDLLEDQCQLAFSTGTLQEEDVPVRKNIKDTTAKAVRDRKSESRLLQERPSSAVKKQNPNKLPSTTCRMFVSEPVQNKRGKKRVKEGVNKDSPVAVSSLSEAPFYDEYDDESFPHDVTGYPVPLKVNDSQSIQGLVPQQECSDQRGLVPQQDCSDAFQHRVQRVKNHPTLIHLLSRKKRTTVSSADNVFHKMKDVVGGTPVKIEADHDAEEPGFGASSSSFSGLTSKSGQSNCAAESIPNVGGADFEAEGDSTDVDGDGSLPLQYIKVEQISCGDQHGKNKNRGRVHGQCEMVLSVKEASWSKVHSSKSRERLTQNQPVKKGDGKAQALTQLPPSAAEDSSVGSVSSTFLLDHTRGVDANGDHACPICQKIFKNVKLMKKHKNEVHTTGQRLPCLLCEKTYKNKDCLYKHQRFVHASSGFISCTVCAKSFKTEFILNRHLVKVHSYPVQKDTEVEPTEVNSAGDESVPCSFPEDRLNDSTSLQNHLNQADGHESCPICQKVFKSAKLVRKHKKEVHTNGHRLPCSICGVTLKNRDCLYKHLKLVHADGRAFSCSVCARSFKTEQCLRRHLLRIHASSLSYPCVKCGKLFKSYRSVKKHVALIHYTTGPFPCPFCNKVLRNKFLFRKHFCKERKEKEGAEVGNKKQYPCPQCLLRFANLDSLLVHMLSEHQQDGSSVGDEDKKPVIHSLSCPYCMFRGETKEQLLPHVTRQHAELIAQNLQDERFECRYCERFFKTRTLLTMHMRIHTGEQPYLCDTCGRSFSQWNTYKCHLNLHLDTKPIQCDMCLKGFNSYSGLLMHKRRHMGDKRYSCDVCGKLFYSSGMLKRHSVVHTNERPLQCSLCEKTYRSVSSLKYHKIRHHASVLTEQG